MVSALFRLSFAAEAEKVLEAGAPVGPPSVSEAWTSIGTPSGSRRLAVVVAFAEPDQMARLMEDQSLAKLPVPLASTNSIEYGSRTVLFLDPPVDDLSARVRAVLTGR